MALITYEGSCKGKARYQTRRFAKREARRVGQEKGRRFRVYRCRFCHGYHLTGMSPEWVKMVRAEQTSR